MKAVFVGNGSWGNALADVARENGHDVAVLGRDDSYSPLSDADIIMLCVPSYALREVLRKINAESQPKRDCLFIGICKGIEFDEETGKTALASQIVKEELGRRYYAHLAGPGFAKGLDEKEDTRLVVTQEDWWNGVTLVSNSVPMTRRLLQNDFLKIQQSLDLIGLQVVGACRTTLSIVMGAAKELGYYHRKNTMAAIFGRIMVEINRFVAAFGGKQDTLVDIAGSGDLYLCNDPESRNFQLGERVAGICSEDPEQRKRLIETEVKCIGTVEGFLTSKTLWKIAQERNIDTPWTKAVYRLCHEGSDPRVIVAEILQRSVD